MNKKSIIVLSLSLIFAVSAFSLEAAQTAQQSNKAVKGTPASSMKTSENIDFFVVDTPFYHGYQSSIATMPRQAVKKVTDGSQIIISAPGLTKNDFNIKIVGNQMVVTGENQINKKTNKPVNNVITRNFKIYYKVCNNADINKITSNYDNGVLIVNVPVDLNKIKKETKVIKIS
ncbi:MAG TPA: Hsp20/alpha crystallin family protein [Victivallales bacterium]|nr:Hsp20/alpha crystallin family protein [Victivallales bacterium]